MALKTSKIPAPVKIHTHQSIIEMEKSQQSMEMPIHFHSPPAHLNGNL
jgi:hypothetical protein